MSKKKVKNPNKSVIIQWGVPMVVLLVVVVVLVTNFSNVSRESAEEAIYKRLTNDAVTYAVTMNNTLTTASEVGTGAASIIGCIGETDKKNWVTYASKIAQDAPQVYSVVFADTAGNGVSEAGRSVSVKTSEYFSNSDDKEFYCVKNDGFTNSPAIVEATPIVTDGTVRGHIYTFINLSELEKVLPFKEYGGGVGFAIINSEGKMLSSFGTNSYFNSGENLFTDLSMGIELDNLTLPQIKVRAEKLTKMAFSAKKGTEEATITIAPIGINDWQVVTIINQKYITTSLNSELSGVHKLIIGMVVTIASFIVLVIVIEILSRLKYGEQSKDLADKADTDLLTELNNKIATERKIQEFMDENPESQCLMFLFDIDNFKKINDTMGHAFGDEVLRTLGHQLRNEFRVSDIIGRLGGDEFVLFLKNVKSDEQLEREGVRITNFFHQFRAGDYVKYSATASIGAAVFPRDAKDFQSLYKMSDVALYEAKRRGKNQLVFYSKDISDVESVRVSDSIEPIADYRK